MSKLSMYQLYQFLPRTDCKKCGFSCMEFANRLIARDVKPQDCPFLLEPEYAATLRELEELLGPEMEKDITGLVIDQEKCNGCGICVVVCEINMEDSPEVDSGRGPAFSDKIVLRVDDGKIKLVDPHSCKRTNPSAHICRACVELCPTKAISLL